MSAAPQNSTQEGVAAQRLKGILFDVDGTLYRQETLRRAMALKLARTLYLKPATAWRTARILSAYRHALEHLRDEGECSDVAAAQLELTVSRSGCARGEVSECIERWFIQEPLVILRQHKRLGLTEFLERARAEGLRMGAVSDYAAEAKLKALGIDSYFDVVVKPGPASRLKPHPSGLQEAMKALHLRPEETIFVGDRKDTDGEAARRAGLRFAWIGAKTATGSADFHAGSYDELARMIFR